MTKRFEPEYCGECKFSLTLTDSYPWSHLCKLTNKPTDYYDNLCDKYKGRRLREMFLWFRISFLRRLKSRIKYVFRFRRMWEWEYESCERCGSCFQIAYSVQDDKWIAVYGSSGGILCLSCFLELAGQKKVNIKPKDINWLCLFNGDYPSHNIINRDYI